jgi:syndecan 4
MLIVHGTLKVYIIHENVFFETTVPSGILKTLYGINQCREGWTGCNCTIPACSNSLTINGINTISVIRFECSGHGKCTETGCICDPLWGGSDCSIYQRSACKGTLLDNFPLRNCECLNSIIGGNDCSVTFCPGDCFGHGSCVNGVCHCHDNYYGMDCSTMVVGFPS